MSAAAPQPRAGERRPEILAPAGSYEALRAALQAGADAVYFGVAEGFNARARAANCPSDDLPRWVACIHRAGARAYLTANTLVFEPELEAVEELVRRAALAGVDALIVQDPAVVLLARATCPELELHASTQMTIANPGAAGIARDLGVSRVVVPRELSVAEIAGFAAASPVELEVFIHGALCVSWSGQCLTSEAWSGRSANRGQCAQSCRMPYEFVVDGEVRRTGDVRYLLSPKDLAGLRAVPELMRLGVHGLKIEGRQKGAQYVATAVRGYRRFVDALAAGDDRRRAERDAQEDLLAMSLSYTRGFGDGFLAGSDHQTLVEGRFPKHRGVYLGRVVRVEEGAVVVRPEAAGRPWTGALAAPARSEPRGTVSAPLTGLGGLAGAASGPAAAPLRSEAGQGVVFDAGHPEDPEEPGGPIFRVEAQGEEWRLGFGDPGPDLARVRAGQRVWVTQDPRLAAATSRMVAAAGPEGRIGVQLAVAGGAGEPLRVTARAGHATAAASSQGSLAPATGGGLEAGVLRAKLGAFGGTPFSLQTLDVAGLAAGLHLPVSELKELRRTLVEALVPQIERGPLRTLAPQGAVARLRAELQRAPLVGPPPPGGLVALCRTAEQIDAAAAVGVREVELDWMELVGLGKAVARARAAGLAVSVATLRVGKPGEETIDRHLGGLGADAVLVRHFGALAHFRAARAAGEAAAGPRLDGDFSLNVTNALTARWLLAQGLASLTPAYDLDEDQLLALLEHAPAERFVVPLYHRIPTFHTEHCTYAHLLSEGRDFRTCGRPCERHQVALRDHLGHEFPVIVDAGCRNTVFHSAVQGALPLLQALQARGVRRFRAEFVREDRRRTEAVLSTLSAALAGSLDPGAAAERIGLGAGYGVGKGRMSLLH
ncbi:MAG: U32 family peptidase [Planctomycetes bacterium]|nr:U32 family peptidase [Planctomycetota bacterium]